MLPQLADQTPILRLRYGLGMMEAPDAGLAKLNQQCIGGVRLTDLTRREWIKATGTVAAAGVVVARFSVPPAAAQEAEMIEIPAGKCLIGTTPEQADEIAAEHGYHVTWLEGEMPQREVDLPAFLMDKYPITNRQYAEFCKATGYKEPGYWRPRETLERLLDYPVISVNRADALAYCEWADKRLPTEDEWEKAARGEEGLTFPWGNEFDPEALRWNPEATPAGPRIAPVDAHPKGASPYGVMDMCGNVAEWCADPPKPHGGLRGGCWMTSEVLNLRAAARNMNGNDNNAANFYGFRCAKEVG